MVQNEYEYIEFIVRSGLQDNTAYSYGRYLEAVSTHLGITIGSLTVNSQENVTAIILRLSKTTLAQNYQNNCGTALRAYLRFIFTDAVKFISPDEITDPDKYFEGSKKKITVNAYERNVEARNKSIEFHGLSCFVCSMNFEKIYGAIGIGYIHVHHIKPLHEVEQNYSVDPEKDLFPVCPNCHAMLHRKSELLSIEQLKIEYNRQKGI